VQCVFAMVDLLQFCYVYNLFMAYFSCGLKRLLLVHSKCIIVYTVCDNEKMTSTEYTVTDVGKLVTRFLCVGVG